MYDKSQKLVELKERLQKVKNKFNVSEKEVELRKLESESMDPGLWDNQEKARKLMQDLDNVKKRLDKLKELDETLGVLATLVTSETPANEFANEFAECEKEIENFEIASFLSGQYDTKSALVSIHAGQGGVEAMDWAAMLYRMYVRYAEKNNFKTEVVDSTEGEEAGFKSVTFKVDGQYAYGYLKKEAGTHRLVRQSPFNADNLRQTSFALVEVLPELFEEDLPHVEIKDTDLEWQFFHSSSKGGQNVQKVATAVRLKHIPSGIVVTAQTERYQEQNRKIALNLLRGRLWLREEAINNKKVKDLKGEYRPASWGNQIRSYVLHPYKMVKDLRTQAETANAESVLDGNLDLFIESELMSEVI